MKALKSFAILTFAVTVLGFGSANADVEREPVQSADQTSPVTSPVARNHHPQEYVCTTYNPWYHYTSTSTSLKYAKHDAIKACMRDGGTSTECHHHLQCTGEPSHPQPTPAPAPKGSYYEWGGDAVGFGYCFQYDKYHQILHNGKGQPYSHCEKVKRSYYGWGYYPGQAGSYCFQWTPYGHVLNDGRAVSNRLCRH